MTHFEDDWSDLLREPVTSTGVMPEDFVEDWCVLRGRDDWFFAGLLDADLNLIPGSTRATHFFPSYQSGFQAHVKATALYIAFWTLGVEPFVSKLSEPMEVHPRYWSLSVHPDGTVGYRPPHLPPVMTTYVMTPSGPITTYAATSGTSNWSASVKFVTV